MASAMTGSANKALGAVTGPEGPRVLGIEDLEAQAKNNGTAQGGFRPGTDAFESFAQACIDTSHTLDGFAALVDDHQDVVDRDKTVLHNMIGGAISFGLALMILVLMALVTGYFVAEVPAGGAFSESINTTVDIGGTGFIIFGVSLLAVPVVALIGYFLRSGLGGFITGGMGR